MSIFGIIDNYIDPVNENNILVKEHINKLEKENADLKKQLSDARHHIDTLIHDCKRYEEVEKENIAICKIKPALNRAREALNPTDKSSGKER